MIHHSKHHHIDSAFIYGLAVLSIVALSNVERMLMHRVHKSVVAPYKKTEIAMFNKEAFSNIKIRGKAYVVYDIVGQKVIAGKNENTVLPLASLTKVMTAITARSHYNRKSLITIRPSSMDEGYDLGLRNGQVWTLDELLKYTLVFSSNDGAQAIAERSAQEADRVARKITGVSLLPGQ